MDGKKSAKPRSGQRRSTCPTCKRAIDLPAEDIYAHWKSFPFCSERCKLIDLGAWLDADYRLPVRSDEELDDLPSECS